ncbi:MAG: hypothetical protein JWN51_948 [Phycisphaerales bacterium]|nr:hypothetical protein [Phycisphaerales bacterium]
MPSRREAPPACAEGLESRTLLSLSGNQLFPADSPWNHPIAGAPVAANSAMLVASVGANRPLHPDFGAGLYQGAALGIPYNIVPGNQPKVPVVIDAYPSESDLLPVPIPVDAVIEGDPLPPNLNTGDRHLIVYDKDNNLLYELFHAHRPAEEADGQWHADSEAVWNMNVNSFRTPGDTSADAAGLPILLGLVRVDETLAQGVINHALRFTVPISNAAYVFPASHFAGSHNGALPRMGERFRLKQNVDISGFSAVNRVILQTLKTYGMIVADNGDGWFLSGSPDEAWNNDDLHLLTRILGSSFEAVDLTPVVTALDRSSGPPGSVVTVSGVNFMGVAGQLQVSFGGVAGTNVTVLSDNTLTVTAPAHAMGAVDVTVTTPYGTSATSPADRFTFTPARPAVAPFTIPNSAEGTATAAVNGSFTGQAGDTFTATVDYGDGSGAQPLPLSGNTFTLTHAYVEGGTYTVSVVVTDTTANLASAPATASAGVSDVPIQAMITGAPATISLGGSVNLNFTAFNPNALETDALVQSWTIKDAANVTVASGTGGPFTFTPTAAGVYVVSFSAGESAVADAETATATATITVNPAAPTLLSTTIDSGAAQRSLVRSLSFKFSSAVTLSAGAVTLAQFNTGGSGLNDGSAPTDASAALGVPTSNDGGITWVIPINETGPFSRFGSLIDGIYQATVHAALVTDAQNQPLAGGDQTPPNFHRLFGDINGDKRVNATDYQQFSAAFGASGTSPGYVAYLDYNQDNRIIANDYHQFAARFGKSFIYT